MADNKTVTFSASGSISGTGKGNHYVSNEFSLSSINTKANSIPDYSKINSVALAYSVNNKTAISSSSKGDFWIYFSTISSQSSLSAVSGLVGDSLVYHNYQNNTTCTGTIYLTAYTESGTANAGKIAYSNATNICFYNKYQYTFKLTWNASATITWNYNEPRAKVTVNNGSGGGTYAYESSIKLTANSKAGHTHTGWSCSNGKTYTAQQLTDGLAVKDVITAYETSLTFTPTYTANSYTIVVDCSGTDGVTFTVTGAGTYKYGDTIKLTASNIPEHYQFEYWWIYSGGQLEWYTNPLSLTINDTVAGYANSQGNMLFHCVVDRKDYTTKASVSPSASAGTVEHGRYLYVESFGEYHFSNYGNVPGEGFTYTAFEPYIALRANPSEGYKFVKWSDGVTDNPRVIEMTGNRTYTAVFEKLPPEFTSASMTYLNKQISASNKVICGESFIISVGVT